jgi:hypothetical protein
MRTFALLVMAACGKTAVEADECADFDPCDGGVCLAGECVPYESCDGDCAPGPEFPLADTSLSDCHDEAGPIDCPGEAGSATCTDTSMCGQDAQYGWDTTHSGGERFSVADADGEALVTDLVTGLQWSGCAMGQGAGCVGDAQRGPWEPARQHCEDSTWGGHDDWVLPNTYELQSIVDYSTTSPAIDTTAFRNAPSLFEADYDEWWIECTWTGQDQANDPASAWAVMVNSGDVLTGSGIDYHGHDKAAEGWVGCYARCVREHPGPDRARHVRFPGEEPVVADLVTERIWQGCSAGQTGDDCAGEPEMLPWPDALSYCEGLSWAGHDDWRLPDMMELGSLPDRTYSRPAIDPALYPNTPSWSTSSPNERYGQFWSSTSRWYQGFALYVSFNEGGSHFYIQEEGRHVRCVRS